MIDLKKNRLQAINYSTVMDALSYSQSKLKALKPHWDQLLFSDNLISENAAELAPLLNVSPEKLIGLVNKVIVALQEKPVHHSILTLHDADYPTSLRQLQNPPPVLFTRGIVEHFATRCVAVVGSRQASEIGRKRAQKLAMLLSMNDYTVVSGLAKGIDTAAHTAAIKAGGRTIAVIGTRLNESYPDENRELQEKIARGNLLVSQFGYAQPISKYNFPQRNYTMMGIAQATVIVEAGETSGALIQARYCLKENRRLFVMKSLLDNPLLKWPKKYVEQGAIVLEEIDQLFQILSDAPLDIPSKKQSDAGQQLTLFA